MKIAAKILILLLSLTGLARAQDQALVYLLDVEGAIGPATSDFFVRGLNQAQEAGAELLILRLDTPGGLDTSMRKINKAILNSQIPVVTFIAPEGARAASAGTYMLYASHIAAMAPATNLGAATPVRMGGGGLPGMEKEEKDKASDAMTQKVLNDARAYIRGLAQKRNRNVQWAEQAVEKAQSLSATEALKINVINLMARDVDDLLLKLNGWKVLVRDREMILNTVPSEIRELKPDWRNRLLRTISNPNIAYILLLIGIYGLIFEFMNPGFLVPGITGAICLLLGLYALHVLPVNFAGVALLLLGLALMITEAFVPSFGALGIGGLLAFVLGSLMLIEETRIPGFGLSRTLVASVALISGTVFAVAISMAVRARRRKVVSGAEEMIGALGEAAEDMDGQGKVFVHSELWAAQSGGPLKKGQAVRVMKRDGLTLWVEAVSSTPSKEE